MNWETLTTGSQYDLLSVFFINDSTGWVIERDYTLNPVLKTIDGGASWTSHMTGTNPLTKLFFINDSIGWAVGGNRYDGLVMKTTDGGALWVPIIPDINQNKHIMNPMNDVFFIDENRGWVVGGFVTEGGIILLTEDGGATWNTPDQWQRMASYRAVFFLDSLVGYIVCYAGYIFKSVDGGRTWSQQEVPAFTDLSDVGFIDENRGWAVGYNGTILRTKTGGDLVEIEQEKRQANINTSDIWCQVYPNPFNPSTIITYNLGPSQHAKLRIYSITGQLMYQTKLKGSGALEWSAVGRPSGIYFLKASVGGNKFSRKLVLHK